MDEPPRWCVSQRDDSSTGGRLRSGEQVLIDWTCLDLEVQIHGGVEVVFCFDIKKASSKE